MGGWRPRGLKTSRTVPYPITDPSIPHEGQSQPNVPAVNSAYTSPSNVDLAVVIQERLYQI